MKIAIIDIGSNSVRLMLTDGKNTLEKRLITTQLSGNQKNGMLDINSINRTVDAIIKHKEYALKNKAEEIYIFATEAVRSSKNKKDFTDKVLLTTNLKVHVLDSKTEAKLGFLGAYTNKTCLVLDIGGASTEIAVGTNDDILYAKSLPIGIVRIKEKVQAGANMETLIKDTIKGYGKVPEANNYYAIGGSAGTIVAMEEQLDPYNPKIVHNYKLKKEIVEKWQHKLENLDLNSKKEIIGLPINRADVILSGVCLLKNIMEMLNIDYITVSENDNLEGYLQYFVNRRNK